MLSHRVKELWMQLGFTPMDPETERMGEAFLHFPAGTHREDIWHWFEETFDLSVAEDLMFPHTGQEKPPLHIDNLVLEMTRRCNLACAHCLRGDLPDGLCDLDPEALLPVLAHTASIRTVTFSGGEPSLAIPAMRRFMALAETYGCTPASFYLVTNGVAGQKELAEFLMEQYIKAEDPESCGAAISVDLFHEEACIGVRTDPPWLRALKCYTADKEHDLSDTEWPMRAGRAFDWQSSREKPQMDWSVDADPEGIRIENSLYVSVNGYAFPDCDLSFAEMDESVKNPGFAIPVKTLYSAILKRYTENQN